jgi:aspartate racemase
LKTIGLIGGMSWESTVEYQSVNRMLGGLHSARIILSSVDFSEIEELQREGRWAESGKLLANIAVILESSGADILLICTNTMHKVAGAIQQQVNIPLLHIADPTADAVIRSGIKKVGLLGTRFTMEEDFYCGRLSEKHGLKVIIPEEEDRNIIHKVIYDELCLGVIKDFSRHEYKRIIASLIEKGAEGIILGCTEIGLLISTEDSAVPLFDTTRLHAESAVEMALI